MAYENIEKLNALLGDKGAGAVAKTIADNEKKIAEILKKIGEYEAEAMRKRAEEEAKRVAEEAAKRAEEERAAREAAEKAAAEKAKAEAEEQAKKAAAKDAEAKAQAQAEKEKPAASPAQRSDSRPAEKSAPQQKPQGERPVYRPAAADRGAVRSGAPQGQRPAFNGQRATYTPSARPQGGAYNRPSGAPAARPPFGQRPMGAGAGVRPARPPMTRPAPPPPPVQRREPQKKYDKTYVERRPENKRALQRRQGTDVNDFDEEKSGYRKARFGKKNARKEAQTIKIDHAVVTSKDIPIKVLSEKLGISAVEITKRLFREGIMKTVNENIDYDDAAFIALELGIDLEYKPEKTAEDVLFEETQGEAEENTVLRAPVVNGNARARRESNRHRRARGGGERRHYAADDRGNQSRESGKRADYRGDE